MINESDARTLLTGILPQDGETIPEAAFADKLRYGFTDYPVKKLFFENYLELSQI